MPEALFCVKVKTNTFILCKTVYFTRTNKCKSPIWSVKVLLKRLLHSWQIAEIIARRQSPRDVWDISLGMISSFDIGKISLGRCPRDILLIYLSSPHIPLGFASWYMGWLEVYQAIYYSFFIYPCGILYNTCSKRSMYQRFFQNQPIEVLNSEKMIWQQQNQTRSQFVCYKAES